MCPKSENKPLYECAPIERLLSGCDYLLPLSTALVRFASVRWGARPSVVVNPRAAAALHHLEDLAQRREMEGFSEVAIYSSTSIKTRLADRDERAERNLSLVDEHDKAAFIQRKPVRGKRRI